MRLVAAVVPTGEARGRLLAWQSRERELLGDWWDAKREHEDAQAARDKLVARRDREVTGVLGGMTARQRTWVMSHLSYATRPRDLAGRRLVLTWLQHAGEVAACEAQWDRRLRPAELRVRATERRLHDLAGEAIATWGPRRCEEMTGIPWRRLKAVASRS